MLTQTKKSHLSDLHFEHKLWTNELGFAGEEILIYEHYLEDLVKRHNEKEMLAGLEHFQNQFIKEKEVMDILRRDIARSEHELVVFAQKHPESFDQFNLSDLRDLKDRMEQFRKIFGDLKARFFQFMLDWK